MSDRIKRLLYRIEFVLDGASAAAMFAMMLILVVDATGRYLFSAPLPWAHDLVSRLLLPAVFFFTLSSALRVNQHVHIDIVHEKLGPRGRNIANAVGTALAAALFVIIAWLGMKVAIQAFEHGERMSGAIEWPVWLYSAFVPLGLAPLVLRLVLRSVESARRCMHGKPPIDVAPRYDESTDSF